MTTCWMLMCWHHFLRGARSSCERKPTDRPVVGRTWTVILKSPLFHENTHTHKHTPLKRTQTILFPFCPQLLLLLKCSWRRQRTRGDKKLKGVKRERRALGRVGLTVAGQDYSFSSQWLVTDCHCYTLLKKQKNQTAAKETNMKAQHALDPTADCLSLQPSRTSATLLTSISATLSSSNDIFQWWWDGLWVHTAMCDARHMLHEEVNQATLKVGSRPLLEVGGTATSTLRGWLDRARGGGRAIRVKTRVGLFLLALLDTKPHKDAAQRGKVKMQRWDGGAD